MAVIQRDVMKQLTEKVRGAKTIVLMDAFLTEMLFSILLKHFKIADGGHFHTNVASIRDGCWLHSYHNKSALFYELKKAIDNKETAYIAADSKKFTNKLHAYAKSVGYLSRLINSDMGAITEPITSRKMTASRYYHGFIVSPSVASGVSFSARPKGDAQFKKVFGYFQGVILPTDICQMLARVRGKVDIHMYHRRFKGEINYDTEMIDYREFNLRRLKSVLSRRPHFRHEGDLYKYEPDNMTYEDGDFFSDVYEYFAHNDRDIKERVTEVLETEHQALGYDIMQVMTEREDTAMKYFERADKLAKEKSIRRIIRLSDEYLPIDWNVYHQLRRKTEKTWQDIEKLKMMRLFYRCGVRDKDYLKKVLIWGFDGGLDKALRFLDICEEECFRTMMVNAHRSKRSVHLANLAIASERAIETSKFLAKVISLPHYTTALYEPHRAVIGDSLTVFNNRIAHFGILSRRIGRGTYRIFSWDKFDEICKHRAEAGLHVPRFSKYYEIFEKNRPEQEIYDRIQPNDLYKFADMVG